MSIQQQAQIGLRYYKTNNDIKKRKKYIYMENGLIVDPYSANNTIASAYYPLLVDQKVDYLLGNQPTTAIEEDKFYQDLTDIARRASAQGIQWVYPYIKKGELALALFPTSELEWFYDDNGDLEEMWRKVYDKDDKLFIYVYDKDGIRIYKDSVKGQPVETTGHVPVTVQMGAEKTTEQMSWGVCPFIALKNNLECVYDLEPIKGLIDTYDIVLSDFANNLEDFQDVTWILKGYDGQDVNKFLDEVRRYKTLQVGENGDARPSTIEIPTDARMAMLDKGEKLIFKFGRGVDTDNMSGGSLTNVAIESHFANLDMKANNFAYQVTEFINNYIDFYNIYAAMSNKQAIVQGDITYNKSTIVNQEDMLKANVEQTGNISERTKLANNPWVKDPDEEMKQLEAERNIQVESLETPFKE